jgi:3-deoxy-7-phosphoheptulonate synthase
MMIVMKAGATEAEIQSVIDRIETVGARAHPSRGEEVTVIGAIGDREHVQRLGLEGTPASSRWWPILKPYKLASAQIRPTPERRRDRRPPHRRRALLDDRRAVHGRDARPDDRHRARGQGGRRLAVPRRRLQAAHVAVRLPGLGQEGLDCSRRRRRRRAPDRHRVHGRA